MAVKVAILLNFVVDPNVMGKGVPLIVTVETKNWAIYG